MNQTGRDGRRRVEPTDEWEQIEPLCGWPEHRDYELIRPLVLFGSPAAERTLQRRARRFVAGGVESLFGSEHARKRKGLPPALRRLVVDLKAEYPAFNLGEIAAVCYVLFGRRPDRKSVRRVLAEEPTPLRMVRRFSSYHEISERRERRLAVVTLHSEGWSAKAIAGYLRVHLRAMEAVRRLQKNPGLGEYRIHAALAQVGIHLSPRTCGRILALNRELYGLEKPKGPSKEKREMPFAAKRRHQFWSTDVRYVKDHKLGGRAYVISVMDNHSRAILSSAVTRTQDLAS